MQAWKREIGDDATVSIDIGKIIGIRIIRGDSHVYLPLTPDEADELSKALAVSAEEDRRYFQGGVGVDPVSTEVKRNIASYFHVQFENEGSDPDEDADGKLRGTV